MESQKPSNPPRPGLEVLERQRVAMERAAKRFRSWIVQNERSVLVRITEGAESRILNSAICSKTEGCVRCSENEREHNERDNGAQAHKFLSRNRENLCQRIYV